MEVGLYLEKVARNEGFEIQKTWKDPRKKLHLLRLQPIRLQPLHLQLSLALL